MHESDTAEIVPLTPLSNAFNELLRIMLASCNDPKNNVDLSLFADTPPSSGIDPKIAKAYLEDLMYRKSEVG